MNTDTLTRLAAVLLLLLTVFTATTAALDGGTQNKTYTDINTRYDWPMPVTTAVGTILAAVGMYMVLASVMQPEFMW